MSVVFNSVSLPSFAQMHTGLGSSIPVSLLSDHDRFPSWEYVMEREEKEGRRLLYRCAEGGLMWVHVDGDEMACTSSLVSDEEARQIWIDDLLYFSDEEVAGLNEALRPGLIFNEALKAALGWKRVLRSFYLPESEGTETEGTRERVFCAHDGGLVSAGIVDEDTLVRSRLIQGREAWEMIQPLVDPQ